jgi:hypothetical protein
LRRIIIIATALVALVLAAVALADFNSYTATLAFTPGKAGTKAKPSPFAETQVWTAHGSNGNQAGPITKIVTKEYGVQGDGKDFPVCTDTMINNAGDAGGWNKVCPAGSLIATGYANALFIPPADPKAAGTPCNPYLSVYNGGQGKQTFFFSEYPDAPNSSFTCAGGAIKTGSAAAYTGTYVTHGNEYVNTLVVPAAESTMAGGTPLYAALIKLVVNWKKITKKVHGKVVAAQSSFACKKGKRPYSFTFTAQNYSGQSPSTGTSTVSHVAKC